MGQLLQSILHRLLQDDSGHEAADHAAEALLPLLLAEGPVLQAEGERMIAGLPDQAAKVGISISCAGGRSGSSRQGGGRGSEEIEPAKVGIRAGGRSGRQAGRVRGNRACILTNQGASEALPAFGRGSHLQGFASGLG